MRSHPRKVKGERENAALPLENIFFKPPTPSVQRMHAHPRKAKGERENAALPLENRMAEGRAAALHVTPHRNLQFFTPNMHYPKVIDI